MSDPTMPCCRRCGNRLFRRGPRGRFHCQKCGRQSIAYEKWCHAKHEKLVGNVVHGVFQGMRTEILRLLPGQQYAHLKPTLEAMQEKVAQVILAMTDSRQVLHMAQSMVQRDAMNCNKEA